MLPPFLDYREAFSSYAPATTVCRGMGGVNSKPFLLQSAVAYWFLNCLHNWWPREWILVQSVVTFCLSIKFLAFICKLRFMSYVILSMFCYRCIRETKAIFWHKIIQFVIWVQDCCMSLYTMQCLSHSHSNVK